MTVGVGAVGQEQRQEVMRRSRPGLTRAETPLRVFLYIGGEQVATWEDAGAELQARGIVGASVLRRERAVLGQGAGDSSREVGCRGWWRGGLTSTGS